ncbi:MAG: ATP-binding protein [Aestuariibacter sp.]
MKDQEKLAAFKIETLGLLSGGIAHDINNILSIIEGHCEIIKHQYPDFDGLDHVREISEAVMRGASLSKQILSFSRNLPNRSTSVQAREVLEDALNMVRYMVPSQVSLEAEIFSERYIKADPHSLMQIIVNLVSNGIHALQDSEGHMVVRLEDQDDIKSVLLTIQDSGKGIESEVLSQVFDPFYTTRHQKTGIGLGLSVVKNLIRDMGGNINIESQVGEGTIVTVTLPYCPIMHELDLDAVELDKDVADINTLLLVEDDETLAALYQDLLLDEGFVVTHAQNGVEGYQMYRSQGPFDVVLTDEHMPIRRGSEMAKLIKQQQPEQIIILLSGFDDEQIKQGLDEGYIDTSLIKPIKLVQLIETIRSYL